MDISAVFFVYGCLAVPGLFMLGLHPLLPGGTHSSKTLIGLVAIAIVSALLALVGVLTAWQAAALAAPIIQFSIFSVGRKVFVRINSRPPIDVAFNFEFGLGADRLYAFVVYLGSIATVCALLIPWMPHIATANA
jgi:hypothetical protein